VGEQKVYTPGPWQVRNNSIWLEVGPVNSVVADVFHGGGGQMFAPGTGDANARLIAAAPDLLAALEAIGPLLSECRCGDPDTCIACQALRSRRRAIDLALGPEGDRGAHEGETR